MTRHALYREGRTETFHGTDCSEETFRKFREWLEPRKPVVFVSDNPAYDFQLLTWGNHDWCGQACSFRSDSPAHARSTDLQILVDESTTIPCSDGTSRHVSVWATPWSKKFMRWAFMKEPSDLVPIYAAIPEGTDILVSHQPPLYYGDRTFNRDTGRTEHVRSRELLDAIERVRPKVVICGHVHGGFGRYEHQGIPIYNVSVVDEAYRHVNAPTVIDLPDL